MLTHVTKELPQIIALDELAIPIDWSRQSIFGHSMGGHGALTIHLASLLGLGDNTQPKQYRSVSAFAPVSNPGISPWGIKAFNGYLQGGVDEGKVRYDATELVAKCKSKENPVHVLVDYGSEDQFLKTGQLLPENFLKKAREVGYDEVQVRVRRQEGYDHSYYFVRFLASAIDSLINQC
jgi:S-formylglutathione hydrolase